MLIHDLLWDFVLPFAIVLSTLSMLLGLIRLIKGPSVVDRLLALDTLYLNSLGLLFVLAMLWQSVHFFIAALLIAMLGFMATSALARYFTTGHVID